MKGEECFRDKRSHEHFKLESNEKTNKLINKKRI